MLTFEVLLCFQPTRYSVTMTMSERRRQLTHRRHFRLFVGTTDAAEEVKLSLQQASGFQTDRKHWAVGGGRQKHIKVHQRFSEYTNINSIMPAWNSAYALITQREIHESWNSPRLWADVLETVNNTETTGTDHTLTYCCFINGLIFNNCWNHNQTVQHPDFL